MPIVVNDSMVELPENMKIIIKRIGYNECARILGKSESYIRYLAAKGEKRIRLSDLRILQMMQ